MNLTMLLDMAADGFGDRVIVGRRDGGITAAQLRKSAQRGAAAIRESGADSVVYLAVNGPAFPVAMFAAAYAGVPLVPLNYRLGADQLDQLLVKHPSAYGIIETDSAATYGDRGVARVTPQEWLDLALADTATEEFEGDIMVPAVVIYTSGTTSAPKGVLLRHENLVSYVFGSVEFMSSPEESAALMSVPPYHIAAVANVITNLYSGRRFIALERFEPQEWLELVRGEGVTNALVVPTMLSRILECQADKSVPSLETLAYGGAPMPSVVIARALETWPDLGFVNAYGLTETSSTVAVLGPEDHREALASDDPDVRARLGSVGRPLPGVEIEIRDAFDHVVPTGTKGRILVKGEQVSAEYDGIGKLVDERGFFDTRDEGYLDEGGFLFIGGRTDDTIIRGAENIAPAEIEDVMLRHPAVLDVAVVGLPDEEWGQRIVAAVVLRDGQSVEEQELRDYVREHLRSSKTPDRIVFWEEMPRTETGKLVRRNVVSMFEERANG